MNIIFSEQGTGIADALKAYPAVFVVSDRKIYRHVAMPLIEHCAEQGVAIRASLVISTSERRKNYRSVEKIQRFLLSSGADRNALVLAIGGGITTDLVGFAACTYKRGVAYANVPTTLLAQVDASIGGKTGCNIGGYKNMAGVICQPRFTFICPEFIKSLPWKIFSAGYAELLKTFIIADPQAYELAVQDNDFSHLPRLIERAAAIKRDIVMRDMYEKGERRCLNLGHTFAHAIEYRSAHSLLHRGISHGHAVAMGMIMAARLSEKEGIAAKGLTDKLISDFSNVGLPVECPWSEEQLAEVMRTDKKAEEGKVNFVLIEKIGSVVIKKM